MKIDLTDAAKRLTAFDNVLILTHLHPDGDTLGSAFALCRGLRALHKRAKVVCSDAIPEKYAYMWRDLAEYQEFSPDRIVAVDVASPQLLGTLHQYEGRIDLCVDHHPSNTLYAAETAVDPTAAATAEMIYQILLDMDVPLDEKIADCIFTGLSTDTGCFRYSNVTPHTMRIAADMMELGARAGEINRVMFETKTRTYIELEKLAMASLEFYYGGICALMSVTKEMFEKSGSNEMECEGLASIPRQVEGVQVGITIREKSDGTFKASVRTAESVNACTLCQMEEGGGHARAAGCTLQGPLSHAKEKIIQDVGILLEQNTKNLK